MTATPTPAPAEAITFAIGHALTLSGGARQTRLAQSAQPGDTTLVVERSNELPSPGRVSVGRATYAYAEARDGELTNIALVAGGTTRPGVAAQHLAGSPVTDLSDLYSELGQVRRALNINTADGESLAIIGRRLGVPRSSQIAGDDQYRALIKAMAYAPRNTVYGLTRVLDVLVGPGNYSIGKDPIGAPGTVVVTLPSTEPTSPTPDGHAYLSGQDTVSVDAQGKLPLGKPTWGHGAVTTPPFVLAEEVIRTAPSAAWTLTGRYSGVTPGLGLLVDTNGSLTADLPTQLAPRVEIAWVATVSAATTLVIAVGNGRRRAQASISFAGTNPVATLGSVTATASASSRSQLAMRLVLTEAVATLWMEGARLCQVDASTLPTSTAWRAAIVSQNGSSTASWIGARVTSTRDIWQAEDSVQTAAPNTVIFSTGVLDARHIGHTVFLAGPFSTRATRAELLIDSVSGATATLKGKTRTGGTLQRSAGVTSLTAGSVPFVYPDDLGATVEVLGSDSQTAGSYTVTALYEVGTGTDLSTYATPLAARASRAKLTGNAQPAANVAYRVSPNFAAGQAKATISDAGLATTAEDGSVTLKPSLALNVGDTYRIEVDRVRSAFLEVSALPTNGKLNLNAPFVMKLHPFYAYNPLGLLDDYLDGITSATAPVKVVRAT